MIDYIKFYVVNADCVFEVVYKSGRSVKYHEIDKLPQTARLFIRDHEMKYQNGTNNTIEFLWR